MPIETEIKYRLTEKQFKQVEQKLNELKAKFIGEDFEENIIYSGEILQSFNAILRIRRVDDKTILTFKKRLPGNSGIKEQIEHETFVENAFETEKIIEQLGCEKKLVYEKRRKIYKFREVEIVLDELPFGLFMEIEGEFMSIKEAEMFIGAEDFEIEYRTYPSLTAELGKSCKDHIAARF